MKNLFRICFVFVLSMSLSLVNGQSVRDVGNFDEVSASSNVSVKLIKSDKQKVEFKMTRGDEADFVAKVKNNRLILKVKSGILNYGNKSKAQVKVYYTDLYGVSASAGASIKSDDLINTSKMDVDVSSGARIDIEVETEKLSADASSGGRMSLEGSAKNGDFDVSSGANLDASDMICDNVTADASSGGDLQVHANKKLNADVSSGGSIRYSGDAEYVNTDKSWSGQVKKVH